MRRSIQTLMCSFVALAAVCLPLAGCSGGDPVGDEEVEIDHGAEATEDPNANSNRAMEEAQKYGS